MRPASTPWSLALHAVQASGEALRRLGFAGRGLDPEALLRRARREAGLEDFGDERFLEPYRVLLEAYDVEAELHLLGRFITRRDILRLLVNRLELVRDRELHPGIAQEEIREPIFILGLPRTGTTHLFNLLALDRANRAPLTWETMFPSPPPGLHDDGEEDPRIARCGRMLRWFQRLVPGYERIHATGARLPQECLAITSHAFASVRFHRTHYVPSYRDWLAHDDLGFAYAFHRRFLQHLQWRRPGARWVLKTPSHLFWLETLLRVYPDARIIQTHRDPLTALASNASQHRALRGAFSARTERPEAEASVRRWSAALETATRLRDAGRLPAERVVDVHHREVIRDPIGTVRRTYRRLDLPLAPEARAAMEAFVADNPRGKHGRHRYRLEEFGFDPETHGARFGSYCERFGIEIPARRE